MAMTPPMAGFFEFSMMRVRGDLDQKVLAELFWEGRTQAQALSNLRIEIERGMKLMGVRSVSELGRHNLRYR